MKRKDPFADIGSKTESVKVNLADPFGDIGASSKLNKKRAYSDKEKAQSQEELETYIKAPLAGMISGFTGKYADRVMNDDFKRVKEESPISSGIGFTAGAIAPGAALSKGVGALGRATGLTSLGRSGLRQGAVTGFLEGLLSDAGEGATTEDRVTRGALSAVPGATLGIGARKIGDWGRQAKIYDKLGKAGFARETKGEIDSALEKLMKDYIEPKKADLNALLEGRTIDINPEYLKGFKRDATLGAKREKGGLDRLAALLEGRAKDGRATISAKRGQNLKEYFDSISNYSKQKPYSESASAKGDRSKAVADLLRGKISGLDPGVSELNEPMSDALKLRQNIRASSETDPIGVLTADPMSSKGQQLLDLDEMAKTRLADMGGDISEAKRMRIRPENLVGIEGLKSALRGAKRLTGKASNAATSLPDKLGVPSIVQRSMGEGKKEALILKLLDSMKQSSSEEE